MRKTNLFYLNENNSNFLTFSNYGEYLTGVCLSTNHKIFPSSFICLDLPFNLNNTLEDFKKFLMCYYENKLACLRDEYDEMDNKPEDLNLNQKLLKYLLEAICIFFKDNTASNIKYYGDIVEHDYNGTYNDSICIVDLNKAKTFSIINNKEIYSYQSDNNNILHNWTSEELGEYSNYCHPIYDNNQKYDFENFIEFDNELINNEINEISFNCIIVLFDVINISIEENTNHINESILDNHKYLNIPYGIWFASENSENHKLNNIELHKENDNISQSWSLVVSSKFTPYPLGLKINDSEIIVNTEKYTYAELLSKNAEILEKYNNLNGNYQLLLTKYNELSNKINNIEQLYPNLDNKYELTDRIELIIQENQKMIDQKINQLTSQFNDLLNQFKWKAINTSNEIINNGQ